MTHECLPEKDFIVVDGSRIYVGPERRTDRRRSGHQQAFEKLLRDFGLDRRILLDRREAHSSWLLLSGQSQAA